MPIPLATAPARDSVRPMAFRACQELLALLFGLALLTGPAVSAEKGTPASAAKQEYDKLVQEYNDTHEHFRNAYADAKTEAEKQKLKYPSPEQFTRRFLDLAEKHPHDPAAVDSLVWIAQNSRSGKELDAALKELLANHANDPKLSNVVSRLVYSRSDELASFLRGVAEKSPLREIKGKALLTLGRVTKDRAATAEHLKTATPENLKSMQAWLGDSGLKALQASDPAALRTEAEQLLETVAAKYANVRDGEKSLGESAKAELYEMRHLAIGMVAPEITGEDLDGKKFKLSDYRGKVVVLDFWGHW
jgi:hypothetical protein